MYAFRPQYRGSRGYPDVAGMERKYEETDRSVHGSGHSGAHREAPDAGEAAVTDLPAEAITAPDLIQQAADLLAAAAAATPAEMDGPGLLACGRCSNSQFIVTPAGRILCADEDCYQLLGYAAVTA